MRGLLLSVPDWHLFALQVSFIVLNVLGFVLHFAHRVSYVLTKYHTPSLLCLIFKGGTMERPAREVATHGSFLLHYLVLLR